MEPTTTTLELEKETKNTFRYEEQTEAGSPPVVRNVYLQKWMVGEEPPEKISLTVEEPED